MNPNKPKIEYTIAQYASGYWDGRWVVVQIKTEDIAAVHSKQEALDLISRLKKADK